MAAWAPLVPLAQASCGLDAATLGVVLLCFGGGSLVAMPAAGWFVARHGVRRVISAAAVAIWLALPFLARADRPIVLAATLFVFGAGLGALDVAMNLQAIAVERASGRAMMSGFHGMFSVGGIVGASAVALALSAGVDAVVTITIVVLALIAAMSAAFPGLIDAAPTDAHMTFALPRGIVLVIGFLAAAAFLVEGAVLDWSAIFLASIRGVTVTHAAAGYIAFAAAMTLGRFAGDRIVQRFGGRRTLVAGALLGASGIALVACVASPLAGVAGFALVGLGNANIVPVLFTSAGRQVTMPASLAVPAMTTMGYAGLLAGPALIGFSSSAIGLPQTFIGLAALLVVVALAGSRLRT